ncbi:MAG: helix-turn-helix transcriptional regulator [Bacteroidetes bacterium]|nr:helix-turn-helix transcriptional regulator [Bacteroidota bacterium]
MPYPKAYLYHRVVKAKLFIDTNFYLPLDLNNISNEAFFSKYHFIRLFKNSYGRTPHQYLIYVRIEKAKNYLKHGVPVSEVCFKVGFESPSSFAGLFKKVCQQTPGEYQRLYKRRQEALKKSPLSFIPNCFSEQKGWVYPLKEALNC